MKQMKSAQQWKQNSVFCVLIVHGAHYEEDLLYKLYMQQSSLLNETTSPTRVTQAKRKSL
jgi:hypothetical protein